MSRRPTVPAQRGSGNGFAGNGSSHHGHHSNGHGGTTEDLQQDASSPALLHETVPSQQEPSPAPLKKRTRRRRNDSGWKRSLSTWCRRFRRRTLRQRKDDDERLLGWIPQGAGRHDTTRRLMSKGLLLIIMLILILNAGTFAYYYGHYNPEPSNPLESEGQALRGLFRDRTSKTRNMGPLVPGPAAPEPFASSVSAAQRQPVEEAVVWPELNLTLPAPCMRQWKNSTAVRQPLPIDPWTLKEYKNRDFGDIQLMVFSEEGHSRVAMHDVRADTQYQDDDPDEADDAHDYYYAFDDDFLRNPYSGWDDDTIEFRRQCRRTNWHRNVPLNCLSFHELGLATNAWEGLDFVGAGSYRQVFLMEQPFLDKNETLAFKEYTYERDFEYTGYEFMRMDALVSERLTGNPLIAPIYGFCALSMLSPFYANGDISEKAQPVTGGRYEIKLNDTDAVTPLNNFTATEKLTLSLEMAEAISALHGFPGGVIVHDDIQLQQFLWKDDGHIVLNDFNRAEIMFWDEEHQEYCRYRNNPGHGDWRAPEEFVDDPLNEKIDVWSLGNNMYALLTGLSPFYELLSNSEVRHELKHGRVASIDPRYRERSYAEKTIVDIIKKCWIHDIDNRIDIFEIVQTLRHAVEENKKSAVTSTADSKAQPADVTGLDERLYYNTTPAVRPLNESHRQSVRLNTTDSEAKKDSR